MGWGDAMSDTDTTEARLDANLETVRHEVRHDLAAVKVEVRQMRDEILAALRVR